MIEQLARAGAEELRTATTSNVEAGLADLHVRQVRHRRRARMGLVAAAILAVGLGSLGGAVLTHRADRGIPPTHPAPTRNHAEAFCPTIIRVTCLGHQRYRFPLVRPVDWRIPTQHFGVGSGGPVTPLGVESYRDDGRQGQSGVTVMERVRASSPHGTSAAAGVADSPRAFVRWVASRPFLSAGPVRRIAFDGRPAWRVRVTLSPGVPPGPATCTDNDIRCYSIVHQADGSNSGIFGDQLSEYTAFRLSRAGTTVVWSWCFGPHPDLGPLANLVDGLSWPAH